MNDTMDKFCVCHILIRHGEVFQAEFLFTQRRRIIKYRELLHKENPDADEITIHTYRIGEELELYVNEND